MCVCVQAFLLLFSHVLEVVQWYYVTCVWESDVVWCMICGVCGSMCGSGVCSMCTQGTAQNLPVYKWCVIRGVWYYVWCVMWVCCTCDGFYLGFTQHTHTNTHRHTGTYIMEQQSQHTDPQTLLPVMWCVMWLNDMWCVMWCGMRDVGCGMRNVCVTCMMCENVSVCVPSAVHVTTRAWVLMCDVHGIV